MHERDQRNAGSGLSAHVRAAIDEGRKQIAEGKGVPEEEAWKELGIE
jgi:hypothetical protein